MAFQTPQSSPPDNPVQFRQLDPSTQARVGELQARALPPELLRRTGKRPYSFNGVAVATVSGITPALPFWYEINIFRTVSDTYVSDIRLFHKEADYPDFFRVEEHLDLETVFEHLEGYDPAGDLALSPSMPKWSTSNAALEFGVARLQMQVNRINQHYGSLVGALLHDIAVRGA